MKMNLQRARGIYLTFHCLDSKETNPKQSRQDIRDLPRSIELTKDEFSSREKRIKPLLK